MYLYACGMVLPVALLLNSGDRRMLALTVLVGASIFLPVPAHTQAQFYVTCILVDLTMLAVCVFLPSRVSCVLGHICAALVLTHFMGWVLDGSPPLSPYRVIVKLLEFSQLAACVALSPIIAPILRNHDATTT